MTNWRKFYLMLLFLTLFGMILLMFNNINVKDEELREDTHSKNLGLGTSAARYDIEQIFQFEENIYYYSFDLQDNYLYFVAFEMGLGAKLIIFDVAVPTAMTKVSTFLANGTLRDLDVEGDFAYIATETEGLMVVNVSIPASPQKVGTFVHTNITGAYIIEVVDTFAYVISNEWEPFFSIINITAADPQNFTLLSGNDCVLGSASDLEITNDYAFICGGRAAGVVEIYNISDPSSAYSLWLFHDNFAMAIEVVGNIAYIADGIDGFCIYDITNLLSPVKIGTYSDFGFSNDIKIRSNLAFIADGYDGLEVIDVSNPTNPQKVGSFDNDKNFRFVQVSNETVYILQSQNGVTMHAESISIVQIEYNFIHPELISQEIPDGIETLHVKLKDDLLFVVDYNLAIYNVSDPTNPTFVNQYIKNYNIRDVKIIGDLAFLLYTGGPSDWKGLEILNISNPSSLVKIGGYENISNIDFNSEIEIKDQLAFICTSEDLVILNISNPILPTKLGNYSFSYVDAMAVRGDVVYIFDQDTMNMSNTGIYVIDVSDPVQPVEIYFNDSYLVWDLFINNDLLYLTGYYEAHEGLHIANISNPTEITQIASYSTTTNPRNVVVEGGFAYIALDPTLIILNVSDPLSPKRLGDCIVGDVIWEAEPQGDYVYTAASIDGFIIIKIDEDSDFDDILDFREVCEYGTNQYSADTDQDGILDGNEVYTYSTNPNDMDSDQDGLTDGSEILTYLTNPNDNDTDSDGIYDQEEVMYGADGYITDPNLEDTDYDGIKDQEELILGLDNFITNPVRNDTDNDGMEDGWEVQYNLTPTSDLDANQDPDADKVTNLQESQIGTDPTIALDADIDQIADDWELFYALDDPNSDHDNDSLTALQEFGAGTNPRLNDTDGDAMDDWWEVQYACNPLLDDKLEDPDGDGLINLQEYNFGTNPSVSDSDGDGFSDGQEVGAGTDPLNKNDHPPLPNYTIYIILIIAIAVVSTLLYLKATGVIWRKAPINVFISHSVTDFETHKIKELAKHLTQKKPINKGFYCEEDLQFNIDEWMEQVVPLCQLFIFISTKNSMKSKDCAKEIQLAKENEMFIVPLKDNKVTWKELYQLGLSRELGFDYDPANHQKGFDELSTYIEKFKSDLDKIYVNLRKHHKISVKKLEEELDLSEMQSKKLINILEKSGQIKGAWSGDKSEYFSEKEVKRRIKTIQKLDKDMSNDEMIEKAGFHPDSKKVVEKMLKSNQDIKNNMIKRPKGKKRDMNHE